MRKRRRPVLPVAAAAAALFVAGCVRHPLVNPLDPEYDSGAGVTVYVSPEGSDGSPGLTPDRPKQSIQAGIDAATRRGRTEVRVMEGTYQEQLDLAPGISLKGGYGPGFAERDPILYQSIVTADEELDNRDFVLVSAVGGDITPEVVIEGFVLEVRAQGTGNCEVIELYDGASPQVRGNRLFLETDVRAYGVWMGTGQGVIIANNVIYLRTTGSTDPARAIYCRNAGALIVNNTIVSTVTDGDPGWGVYWNDESTGSPSSIRVLNNILVAPDGDEPVLGNPGGQSAEVDYDYNLCIGFKEPGAEVTDGGHNQLVDVDILGLLFRSELDLALADGDDTDYRLYDPEGIYAVDRGMDTGGAQYGEVVADIAGNPRPAEDAYDIGAYEKTHFAVFVSPEGSDSSSGLSADESMASIQAGIEAAPDAGASEVRVAAGTYKGSLTLQPRVSVLGGYGAHFAARDWATYVSRVAPAETGTELDLVRAEGGAIGPDVRLEGLTLEIVISSSPAPEGLRAVYLGGSASPTISHNRILVDRGSVASEGGTWGIVLDGGQAAALASEISDNVISVADPNGTGGNGSTGIEVKDCAGGCAVVIERNRITAMDASGANALTLSHAQGVVVKNNILSAGQGNSGGINAIGLVASDCLVVNNTMVVDGQTGTAPRGIFAQGAGELCTARVFNNIFASRWSGGGVVVEQEPSYEVTFDYNLCFFFPTQYSGTVSWGPNGDFEAGDLFVDVFGSAQDSDLTDGDDTDYHLHGTGDWWAVDRGMDASAEGDGAVTGDIDGEERPKGAGWDRGPDEAR